MPRHPLRGPGPKASLTLPLRCAPRSHHTVSPNGDDFASFARCCRSASSRSASSATTSSRSRRAATTTTPGAARRPASGSAPAPRQLGLQGRVSAEQFNALLAGQGPARPRGAPAGRGQRPGDRRVGSDVQCAEVGERAVRRRAGGGVRRAGGRARGGRARRRWATWRARRRSCGAATAARSSSTPAG